MASDITLYTAHECPFAHRAQIALRELGLSFKTSLVDITTPRTPEYLAINPNGMVPALAYDNHVLTESGLIAQFLVDAHPSHLLRASNDPAGAFQRFEIGFLVDVYFGMAHELWDSTLYAVGVDAKADMANKYIDTVVRHVEPLLANATPFFGGSDKPTFAEVLIGPFLIRVLTLPHYEHLVPGFVHQDLKRRAPNFWRWAQTVSAEESVTAIWDEELVAKHWLYKIAKRRKVAQ